MKNFKRERVWNELYTFGDAKNDEIIMLTREALIGSMTTENPYILWEFVTVVNIMGGIM